MNRNTSQYGAGFLVSTVVLSIAVGGTQPVFAQNEACCLASGICQDTTPASCTGAGGVPQGPGTTCATVTCPQCNFNGDCDDGLYCNGEETCDGGNCQPGSEQCFPQFCRESDDLCVDCLSNAHCDDGLFCSGIETCEPDGRCSFLEPPHCEDDVECTLNICNESLDRCENPPDTCSRLYVNAGAAGNNGGGSWFNALLKLQDALSFASTHPSVTEIWVAAGTYKPDQGTGITPGDRTARFQLLNGVALYGGFAGGETLLSQRNIAVNETILFGDLLGDDAPVACTQDSPDCDSFGGLCGDDGFCIIGSNNAENSYHIVTASGTDATAILDGFGITAGNADGGCCVNDRGAGMYNNAGSPTVTNCTFSGNSAMAGGGMFNFNGSSPTVTNCTFSGNWAITGGGMFNFNGSSPTVTNCTFSGNWADFGGGMRNDDSSPTVTDSTFSGNSANNGGGMLNNFSSSPMVTNCVLWRNSDSGGMDESAQIHTDSGTPVVNYSIVQGGWTGTGGTGNRASDPLFLDADGTDNIIGTEDDDLRLLAGSPAIDAGDTTALPADVADLDGDGNTTERIPLDLAGNPRVVDIFSVPDTGVPGSPVVDMGAYEVQFGDCDNDGIPDLQEIADCISDPACDDCNLNFIPDGCDISSGFSLDVDPADGKPDECVAAGVGVNWSDDIWGLSGASPYPDNLDGVGALHVTLDDISLFFDLDAEIQTLRILEGATLRVTQSGTEGDLAVVDPGGVLNEGTLLVANDRAIEVFNGPLTIGAGGLYAEEDPGDIITTSARLTAVQVNIVNGLCDPFTPSGAMELSESMTVATSGDFVLDGRGADPTCSLQNAETLKNPNAVTEEGGAADGGTVAGGRTPPILSIRKTILVSSYSVDVEGDFKLLGSAEVCVACDGQTGDDPTVSVAGDFDNQSQYATLFDWDRGTLLLDGTGLQTFEAAGIDVGAIDEGFFTDRDTLTETSPHQNFSLPGLEIAAGGEVNFVNQYVNTVSLGACAEALYVDKLTLGSGAIVRLDNVRVYYRTLIDNGASIVRIGCGDLLETCRPTTAMAATGVTTGGASAVEPRQRYLAIRAGDPGRRQAVRVIFDSLPDPWDLWNGTVLWVEAPRDLSEIGGQTGNQPPTFKAAELSCAGPVYRSWDPSEVVHVYHPGIVPGGAYRIQVVDESCATGEENNFSPMLTVMNPGWGNVAGPYRVASGAWTVPDSSVDVTVDVVAVLGKFANRAGAPGKSRADVEPCIPDFQLNISDVTQVLNAFRGLGFPFRPGMPPGAGNCVSMDPCTY